MELIECEDTENLMVDGVEHYRQRLYYWLRPRRLLIVEALWAMYVSVVRLLVGLGRLLCSGAFRGDWNEVLLRCEPRNELDAEGDYELEAEHGDKEYDDVAWPNTNSFD